MSKRRAKKVAVILCHGAHTSEQKIDKNKIDCDCTEALIQYKDSVINCEYGCMGLGSCIKACWLNAINKNKHGFPEIDNEKCVGCGLCVKACPKNLIEVIPPEYVIMPRCSNTDKGATARKACNVSCIACRICEKNCPVDAINIIDNHAVIDKQRCVMCGMCAVKCPRKTIVDANKIFTK